MCNDANLHMFSYTSLYGMKYNYYVLVVYNVALVRSNRTCGWKITGPKSVIYSQESFSRDATISRNHYFCGELPVDSSKVTIGSLEFLTEYSIYMAGNMRSLRYIMRHKCGYLMLRAVIKF